MEAKKDQLVFIVDDDPQYRELFRQYTQNRGFGKTELYANGQECLNLPTEEPDIILPDHQMAPLNGFETLKKINRFNPGIFMVYISAHPDMQVTINALKYGAFDYIINGDNKEESKISNVMARIATVREILDKPQPGKWGKFMSVFTKHIN